MINACTGGLWGMASLWGMLDGLRNARIATMSSEATKELDMIVYSERCQNLYIKCWTECSSLRCMVNSTKAYSFLVYWPSFPFNQPIHSSTVSACARIARVVSIKRVCSTRPSERNIKSNNTRGIVRYSQKSRARQKYYYMTITIPENDSERKNVDPQLETLWSCIVWCAFVWLRFVWDRRERERERGS